MPCVRREESLEPRNLEIHGLYPWMPKNRRICVLKVASISRKTSNDAAYESLLIGTISTGLEEG